jgi:hypothetical protein
LSKTIKCPKSEQEVDILVLLAPYSYTKEELKILISELSGKEITPEDKNSLERYTKFLKKIEEENGRAYEFIGGTVII